MSWMDKVAEAAESRLTAAGIQLTLGGEPTLVPLEPEGAEWSVTADGPTKLPIARELARDLQQQIWPGSTLLYCPGKRYDGEVNPRWALRLFLGQDGTPPVHWPAPCQPGLEGRPLRRRRGAGLAGPGERTPGGGPASGGPAGSPRSRASGLGRSAQRHPFGHHRGGGADRLAGGALAPGRAAAGADRRPGARRSAAAAAASAGGGAPPGAHPRDRCGWLGAVPAAPRTRTPAAAPAGGGRQPGPAGRSAPQRRAAPRRQPTAGRCWA